VLDNLTAGLPSTRKTNGVVEHVEQPAVED